MNLIQKYLISLLLLLVLSSNCFAVTEFICTINKTGEDYNSVELWEDATDNAGDITAADCKVFSHGGITGTVSDGASVTGLTSGATGTVIHATSTQILIDAISGTFQSGEVVQVSVGNSVTISSAGDSAIITAELYNDDGNMSAAAGITISGCTTNSTNYRKVTAPSAERHNGNPNGGVQFTNASAGTPNSFNLNETNFLMEWVVIKNTGSSTANRNAISSASAPLLIRNVITTTPNAGIGEGRGIGLTNLSGTITVLNSISYDSDTGEFHATGTGGTRNYKNCTAYSGNTRGFFDNTGTGTCENCLSIGNATADYAIDTVTASGASDTTGTIDNLVATTEFVDSSGSPYDLHLKSGATSIDAGNDLATTNGVNIDIDGYDRDAGGGAWDFGADEFVSSARRRTSSIDM